MAATFPGVQVAEYRVYAIGPDGHIAGWEPLICQDDRAAINHAGQIFPGQIVELWCGERFVARLSADHGSD